METKTDTRDCDNCRYNIEPVNGLHCCICFTFNNFMPKDSCDSCEWGELDCPRTEVFINGNGCIMHRKKRTE